MVDDVWQWGEEEYHETLKCGCHRYGWDSVYFCPKHQAAIAAAPQEEP